MFKKIKWLISELIKMYSSENSFFSKKRVESGIAFIIAQGGMILFLVEHYPVLSIGEFMLWAGGEFAVAGYILNKIEKNKTNTNTED